MATTGPARTRYARNGDVDIVFEDLGGAGGDPLLLVMGLGFPGSGGRRGWSTS